MMSFHMMKPKLGDRLNYDFFFTWKGFKIVSDVDRLS